MPLAFRAVLRVTVPLLVLFTLALTLVRARPATAPAALDVILPPDCAPACPMGIAVGRVTIDEAVEVLVAHPYVGAVEYRNYAITWTWADDAPSIVARAPYRDGGRAYFDGNGVVMEVNADLSLRLGAARWLFGTPDTIYMQRTSVGSGLIVQQLIDDYAVDGLLVRYPALCARGYRTDLIRRAEVELVTAASNYSIDSRARPISPRQSYQEIACASP
ncbi:MAG: hypothetical protein AAF125_21520, partial [Chloroflexota bacterium]